MILNILFQCQFLCKLFGTIAGKKNVHILHDLQKHKTGDGKLQRIFNIDHQKKLKIKITRPFSLNEMPGEKKTKTKTKTSKQKRWMSVCLYCRRPVVRLQFPFHATCNIIIVNKLSSERHFATCYFLTSIWCCSSPLLRSLCSISATTSRQSLPGCSEIDSHILNTRNANIFPTTPHSQFIHECFLNCKTLKNLCASHENVQSS